MDLYAISFYLFSIISLVAAAIVVFSKNIVHAAFALLFAFFGVAGIYVLLMADFIAVTQLLVYVGGILVLLLFGVMLTSRVINVQMKASAVQTLPGVVIMGVLAGILVGIFWSTDWALSPSETQATQTASALGQILLTEYLLPFEIASVILLVALVGAAMIARRERTLDNESSGE